MTFYLLFWNNFKNKKTTKVSKKAALINPNPSIKIKNKLLSTSDFKTPYKTKEIRKRMKNTIKLFRTILMLVLLERTFEEATCF